MRSWVQVLKTASCRNAAYIRPKVVGPFPESYASGSYVHRAVLFYRRTYLMLRNTGNHTSIGPQFDKETIDGSKVFNKATPSLLTIYKDKIFAKK
jgi:hypothetical protein